MPNHVHGILIEDEPRRGEVSSPMNHDETSPNKRGDPTPHIYKVTLGRIVAYFKYQSTKAINEMYGTPGVKFWQRSYYDRIVRNDTDLTRIRTYIANNPLQWAHDEENPTNEISTQQ